MSFSKYSNSFTSIFSTIHFNCFLVIESLYYVSHFSPFHIYLAGKYMQFLLLVLFHLQLPIWWILPGCMILPCFLLSVSYYHFAPLFSSAFLVSEDICFDRDLHNNKLTGPIPSQIGRLKHLKILYSPLFSHR